METDYVSVNANRRAILSMISTRSTGNVAKPKRYLVKDRVAAMPGKNRWFRISLRTFLVVFTCVAVTVVWFARYAQHRWAAFAAIQKVGGDIQMGIGEPSRLEGWFGAEVFGSVNKVDLRKGKADNELLTHVGVSKELRRLDLSNADIDDEGLRRIAHLPLHELWLQETNITDASAATLSIIRTLDFLQVNARPGYPIRFVIRLETKKYLL